MNDGVSVIIPAYNYGRFLAESIDSALQQTLPNVEVIVVDDGSTDNTRSIAFQFTDSRLRYIYQANQGLSAARNTGILNARYAFIAFLDADDLWLPPMIESALSNFSRLPSDFAVVACGLARMNADGEPIDQVPVTHGEVAQKELKARDIVIKSRFMPSTVVVRREVFGEVGLFDTGLRSSEDRDMWIRIGEKYRIHYYAERLVRIRKHGNNMSRNADRMRVNMRMVLKKYFSGFRKAFCQPITFLKSLAFHEFELAWMYYDEGRATEAISSLLASLALWPVFFNTMDLDQPTLFRTRALARFILNRIGLFRP